MGASDKIRALRDHLATHFLERHAVVDAMIGAALAREHVLLIGPPGTAKSALSRALAGAFSGTYFERLLTRFTVPDEIFGPVSLRALEQDRFERVTQGKLPEAEFAFLDEVFLANSAILNSLLTIMNERLFHNGGDVVRCPLVTIVGASNSLPEGRDLDALFDRFLVRCDVQSLVQLSNRREILTAPESPPPPAISLDDLRAAQAEVAMIEVPSDVVDGVIAIGDACKAEGIVASDRRWKNGLKLVRASAYVSGESKAQLEDLGALVDALWREPRERAKVARIVGQRADPTGAKAAEILESAREQQRGLVNLAAGEKSAYVAEASKVLSMLDEQTAKLRELQLQGGRRSKVTVADAMREVRGMYAETQRVVASSLGLQTGLRALDI